MHNCTIISGRNVNKLGSDLEIIDFERKGNVIRFYLGKNGGQWGDDWNDRPYECNAGIVYNEYVTAYVDVAISFDCLVLEPCDGVLNSQYSKEDMIERKVPCIVIVPAELANNSYNESFHYWSACKHGVYRVYFGDKLSEFNQVL